MKQDEKQYCVVCGALIRRRQRRDGRAESITQYRQRKTCGAKTRCYSVNASRVAEAKKRSARGDWLPDARAFSLRPKIVNGWQIL